MKFKNQRLVIIIVVALLTVILLSVLSSGSTDAPSSDSSSGGTKIYSVQGDSTVDGWAKLGENEYGSLTMKWVFVITDNSLTNNGTCIDKSGTYCQEDSDGSRQRLAETYYRYGLTIGSTEKNETVAAGSLTPIYCNKDAVLADLAQFHEKEYSQRTDYNCGKSVLAGWQPTDSFIVIGMTSIGENETIEGPQTLNIYDTHQKWSYVSSSTANSGSVTIGPEFSSNEIKDQPFVKSYEVTITDLY